MKSNIIMLIVMIVVFIYSFTNSWPDINGTTPGCAGSSCHSLTNGIVTAEALDSVNVKITVSGATGNVAGELVDNNGVVRDFIDKTSSNTFILKAPSTGTYTVNAGFKSPSKQYGTTTVVLNVSGVNENLIDFNPNEYKLYTNYPNPFNPSTKIRYAIPQTSFTTLKVYSVTGKEVATLINEEKTPGVYEVSFDGKGLSSGIYFYKLQSGSFSDIKKMILLK